MFTQLHHLFSLLPAPRSPSNARGTVDATGIVTVERARQINIASMRVSDWATLILAAIVVALAVNSELRDIRSCTIMFGEEPHLGHDLVHTNTTTHHPQEIHT